ncbi:DMBT1 protein, partial [Bucco capensis]|nr:DMBT1 protein [Bucco capensis]
RCAGRVEVLHDHQWGTICDDDWDLKDAKVVCRQLGCGTAVSVLGQAHFGQGSDPIWLDDVECTGTETSFSQCRLQNWKVHNCNHEEDAGVVCSGAYVLVCMYVYRAVCEYRCVCMCTGVCVSTAPIRLVNGSTSCSGRVEVFHEHWWGTICDDGWDLTDAQVVCRQLGCG